MRLKVDPEFRDLIPPLSAEERAGLEASIKREGCHTPIITWREIIVDGHNRYDICAQHKKPFECVSKRFNDRREAIIWIIGNQLHRRNISETTRMDLALLMKSEIQALAQSRQKRKPADSVSPKSDEQKSTPFRTDSELAAKAGVGKTKLREYEKVKEQGAPELLEAVRAEKISVHAAAQAAELPSEKQREIAALPKRRKPKKKPPLPNELVGKLWKASALIESLPSPEVMASATHPSVNVTAAIDWLTKFQALKDGAA